MKTISPSLRGVACAFATTIFILFSSCGTETSKSSDVIAEQAGTTVNVRVEGAVTNLNMYLSKTAYSLNVALRIFQSLGDLDPKTQELVPMMVKALPLKRDVTEGPYKGMLAFDFEILDEAVWDNGSPVTGKDVEFSFKILFHPNLPTESWRSYFGYMVGMDVDPANPKKFTAYFNQYYMLMVEGLCGIPIYPAYNYDPNNNLTNVPLADFLDPEKAEQLKNNPAVKAFAEEFLSPKYANDKNYVSGSGPYRLESTDGDQGTILIKKQGWWGDALLDKYPILAAYPGRLSYKIVPDEAATENYLKTEALDVVSNISPAKFLEMKQTRILADKYDFHTYGATQYTRWAMNMRSPKLNDKRVRQALAYLVDYDYLTKTVMQDLAERIVGPVNPSKSFYAKNVPLYQYNVEKAKSLLAEAGWADTDKNGVLDKVINGVKTELSLDLITSFKSKPNELSSLSIKENAQLAGIRINVRDVDIERLSAETKEGRFETAIYGAAIRPGLVELYQSYHSASLSPNGDNRTGFSQADSVIVAIRTTEDNAKRNALYIKAQEIIHDEVPEVYLFAQLQRIVVAKKFDYVISPNRPGYFEQMFKLKLKQTQ